jgi:predicted enzyme involved in methoxymalonyl-ACP biosynthesis
MNNALIDVYKKELAKYKQEHFIYKNRLAKYEDLNIPPTDEEKYNEMMENTFKEAYEEEQKLLNSDIEKVNILIKRLSKPILTPYLDDIINHLETLINKIENQTEQEETKPNNDDRLNEYIKMLMNP